MDTPEYDLCKLRPTEVSLDVIATSIDGGRSLAGITQAIDHSGGGYVALTYGGIPLYDKPTHLAWNWVAGWLAGGVRRIIVPLQVDYTEPINSLGAITGTFAIVPHSDGRLFSDGSGYQQGIADVVIVGAKLAGDTIIQLKFPPGFQVANGIWFAINHATKGWHAYRIIQVSNYVGDLKWNVTIQPAIREATPVNQVCEFHRPKCIMRLRPGANTAWRYRIPGVSGSVDLDLIEALP